MTDKAEFSKSIEVLEKYFEDVSKFCNDGNQTIPMLMDIMDQITYDDVIFANNKYHKTDITVVNGSRADAIHHFTALFREFSMRIMPRSAYYDKAGAESLQHAAYLRYYKTKMLAYMAGKAMYNI